MDGVPVHVPADVATTVAVVNSLTGWFPVTVTVVAGLFCILNYALIFYDRFKKK